MRAVQKTFAEEFERVLVESDTSVRRLARISGISRRTLENWLYGHTLRPRYLDQILEVVRALRLPPTSRPVVLRPKNEQRLWPGVGAQARCAFLCPSQWF